jgi:hypothetical protein
MCQAVLPRHGNTEKNEEYGVNRGIARGLTCGNGPALSKKRIAFKAESA